MTLDELGVGSYMSNDAPIWLVRIRRIEETNVVDFNFLELPSTQYLFDVPLIVLRGFEEAVE
jgi:hypothetical protein